MRAWYHICISMSALFQMDKLLSWFSRLFFSFLSAASFFFPGRGHSSLTLPEEEWRFIMSWTSETFTCWTKGKKKMEAKKVTVTKMQILYIRCEKKLGIPPYWNAEDYSVGMKIKVFFWPVSYLVWRQERARLDVRNWPPLCLCSYRFSSAKTSQRQITDQKCRLWALLARFRALLSFPDFHDGPPSS